MKSRSFDSLILVVLVCLTGLDAAGGPAKVPPEVVGTWGYTSMTALKNGKPFGTVHFRPGQWTVTFNQDATWAMKPPSPPAKPEGLSGSYAVHGHDVDMKLANGSPYYKYRFTVEQDGKVLTLTTAESTISASKE
jgi:hypothetical protein